MHLDGELDFSDLATALEKGKRLLDVSVDVLEVDLSLADVLVEADVAVHQQHVEGVVVAVLEVQLLVPAGVGAGVLLDGGLLLGVAQLQLDVGVHLADEIPVAGDAGGNDVDCERFDHFDY